MIVYWPLQEMERSTDVLAAGLLDVSDPGLSNKYFLRQVNISEIFMQICLTNFVSFMAKIPYFLYSELG